MPTVLVRAGIRRTGMFQPHTVGKLQQQYRVWRHTHVSEKAFPRTLLHVDRERGWWSINVLYTLLDNAAGDSLLLFFCSLNLTGDALALMMIFDDPKDKRTCVCCPRGQGDLATAATVLLLVILLTILLMRGDFWIRSVFARGVFWWKVTEGGSVTRQRSEAQAYVPRTTLPPQSIHT